MAALDAAVGDADDAIEKVGFMRLLVGERWEGQARARLNLSLAQPVNFGKVFAK